MKQRERAVRGEVVAKQLNDGLWAYLIFCNQSDFYLCNFLSRGLVGGEEFAQRQNWIVPVPEYGYSPTASPYALFSMGALWSEYVTVGHVVLSEAEADPWHYRKGGPSGYDAGGRVVTYPHVITKYYVWGQSSHGNNCA